METLLSNMDQMNWIDLSRIKSVENNIVALGNLVEENDKTIDSFINAILNTSTHAEEDNTSLMQL